MDLDSYILRHGRQWDRLEELTHKRGDLTGAEADEVVDLYQRVSTHLSVVRSAAADPVLEARLSALVANARSVVTGVTLPILQTIGRFLTAGLPAALYRSRRWWITVGLVCIAVTGLVAWRVINEPGLAESLLTDEEVKALVNTEFASYYTANPAADFAFQVWVNNAVVTATCLVLGIAIAPVFVVLWSNMSNLGVIAGYMIEAGRADVFFGLLLPHGMLELTMIFVAAGTALRLGWTWIAPGPRTRAQALAAEGRTVAGVAIGLAIWLLISGLIEGFISARVPVVVGLTIGALAWIGFMTYVFTLGRWAAKAGETGDIAAEELDAQVPTDAAV